MGEVISFTDIVKSESSKDDLTLPVQAGLKMDNFLTLPGSFWKPNVFANPKRLKNPFSPACTVLFDNRAQGL